MAIAKCTFCGKEQEDFRGTYFVKNDGTVLYFSSSKCMKNHLKLKRDKRKIRWAEAFHIQRNKKLAKEKEKIEKEKAGNKLAKEKVGKENKEDSSGKSKRK